MNEILKILNFPKKSELQKRIPIKTIVNNLNLNKNDENLMRSHISSIYLVSILDSETTHLHSKKTEEFIYEQIFVFIVNLKQKNKIISLDRKLHSYFPNPTIFIYILNDKYKISTSDKRINLVYKNLSVVKDVYKTDFFNDSSRYKDLIKSLDYRNNKYKDLYDLYIYYQNVVFKDIFLEMFNKYPIKQINIELVKEYIKKIDNYKKEMNNLEEQVKNIFSMKDNMDLHNKLAELNNKEVKLTNELREELY